MTTRFASAAEMMSRVLGMPGYAFAQIGHPVSSATDEQLRAMARMAIEQGLNSLNGNLGQHFTLPEGTKEGVRGMKPMAILGVLLIVIGIAGLAIDNISFTERKTIVDAGPLKVTADEQRTIPIPTIAGIVAVVAGAGLLLMGRAVRS